MILNMWLYRLRLLCVVVILVVVMVRVNWLCLLVFSVGFLD